MPIIHMDPDNNPLNSTCEGPIIHLASVNVWKRFLFRELLIGCAWSTKIVKMQCNSLCQDEEFSLHPASSSLTLVCPWSHLLWFFGEKKFGQLLPMPTISTIFQGSVVPALLICAFLSFAAFLCSSRAVFSSFTVSFSLVNNKDSSFISENEVTLWYECSTHPQAFHSGVFPWLDTIRTGCDSYVRCIHGGYCGGQWSCTLINCLSSHSLCIPLESIPPSAVDSWMFIFWNVIFAGKLASA